MLCRWPCSMLQQTARVRVVILGGHSLWLCPEPCHQEDFSKSFGFLCRLSLETLISCPGALSHVAGLAVNLFHGWLCLGLRLLTGLPGGSQCERPLRGITWQTFLYSGSQGLCTPIRAVPATAKVLAI